MVCVKASFSPSLSKGNYNAFEDIGPHKVFVVTPSKEGWPMKENINVVSLKGLKAEIDGMIGK